MSKFIKIILGLFFTVIIFFSSPSQAIASSCLSNGTGGGDFNVVATWINCAGTTPQTLDSITINSGDTVTLVATTTVAGITINNGGILAANTRTLTNTDWYTNNGSHTGTTSTMRLSGLAGSVIDGLGTYSPTGIVTISVGSKTVASGSNLSFSRITVTGVTLTNNSTQGLTIVTALAGTGQLTQGSGSILNLGGTTTITSLDASVNANEVHYVSTTANQTIKVPTSSYYNLFIDKATRTGTLGGAITINGNLSVTAGTLADGGFQITGNASNVFTLALGTTLTLGTAASATSFPTSFTAENIVLSTTSTVNYNSNSAQTISNLPTYGNLTTTATSLVTKTAAGPFTVNGLFTNGVNNVFADGGFAITLKDGSVMAGTHTGVGKILLTGGSTTHSVSGTGSYNNIELDDSNGVTQSATTNIGGTLTITNGNWTTSATLAVTGDTLVSSNLSVSSTAGTKTFGNITINTGGVISFSAAEAFTINGNLTVNGTGSISGTSGIWTFQKIGGGAISGTTTSLTILGNTTFATQYSILVPFIVNRFTVSSGVNETNNGTITVNTALSGAGTFTQGASSILNLFGTTTITTLDASVNSNEVHYLSTTVNQTLKATTYYNLFIEKNGRTGTVSSTTNVLGNLVVTLGSTLALGSSTLTVSGITDIYGTLSDTNNTGLANFGGLVTVYSSGSWGGHLAEPCDFSFSHGFVFNGTSFVTGEGIYTFLGNNQSITGSSPITLGRIVVTGINLTNSNTGLFTVRTSLSGTGTFTQDNGSILSFLGTNTVTTFDASRPSNTVKYAGVTEQAVKNGTYDTLSLSLNTSNEASIAGDTTVNALVDLGDTKLVTGSNKIIFSSSASWSRINGYVFGTISKFFNTSTSFTFPVGDSTNYSPIDLTLFLVANNSSIEVSTTPTDNPDTIAGNSNIESDKSVNRFWSIVNNGLSFGSYDIVLHFVSSDTDVGANPQDMTIAKKSTGSWDILTSVCTTTSCTSTNLTSMSEFQIGVRKPSVGSSSVSSAVEVISSVLPQINPLTLFASEPSKTTESPALFDILSSPLFPNLGKTNNAILFLVIGFSFFAGNTIGIIFLAAIKRRRRSRVLRVSRRRHIVYDKIY